MVLTRSELAKQLEVLGVDFPPTATLQQLQNLFESTENGGDSPPNSTDADNLQPSDNIDPSDNVQRFDNLQRSDELQFSDTLKTTQLITAAVSPTTQPSHNLLQSQTSEVDDDAVIEQLEKKKKILQLRRELQALEEESVIKQLQRLSITDIEGLVPPFSGDDAYGIEKWIYDFENVLETSRSDDHFKFMAMRRLMKGTAAVYLRTSNARNFRELKQGLLKQFKQNVSVTDVYRQLQIRARNKGENVIAYMLSIQEIAAQANIDEGEVIGFIIEGLRDKTAYTSMLYTATTLEQLKELLIKYDKKRSSDQPAQRNATSTPDQDPKSIRCFNCSQFGHFAAQCTKAKRPVGSCFRCGSASHMRKDCQQGKVNVISEDPEASQEFKPQQLQPFQNQFFNHDFPKSHTITTRRRVYKNCLVCDTCIRELMVLDVPPQKKRFPADNFAEWNNGHPLGLRTVHAYVLVFDMGNLDTFQYCRSMRDQILDSFCHRDFSIIVVGNKFDTITEAQSNSQELKDISTLVRKHWRCGYVECSAQYNYKIGDVFRELMGCTTTGGSCIGGIGGSGSGGVVGTEFSQSTRNKGRCTIL